MSSPSYCNRPIKDVNGLYSSKSLYIHIDILYLTVFDINHVLKFFSMQEVSKTTINARS